jgi:hypothetical protein
LLKHFSLLVVAVAEADPTPVGPERELAVAEVVAF